MIDQSVPEEILPFFLLADNQLQTTWNQMSAPHSVFSDKARVEKPFNLT